MAQTPTRLLILTNQIKFSTTLKRTLEQVGGYEVYAFTSTDAALDALGNQKIDVLMIDFELTDNGTPLETITQLRKKHPELAVVVSPTSESTRAAQKKYDLQAIVDVPISARRLMPILQKAIANAKDAHLPETTPTPETLTPTKPPSPPKPESLPVKRPPPPSAKEASKAPDTETDGEKGTLSERGTPSEKDTLKEFSPFDMVQSKAELGIVADEIPVEAGAEGTSTLDVDMSDVADAEDGVPEDGVMDADDHGAYLFDKLIAEEPPVKLEDSGTVGDLSKEILLADTGARQVIEILRDNRDDTPPSPPKTFEEEVAYDDGMDDVPNLARQILKDIIDKQTPLEALEVTASVATEMDEDEATEHGIELGKSSIMEPIDPDAEPKTAPDDIALALRLTQASMELTAEASLLSEEGQVIAAAGDMPEEDINELKAIIAGDWEANEGKSRIRFITLESSGKDYMLFSRKTELGYTLTMIFAGNMPLRVIRRQSDRLIEALNTPVEAEAMASAPVEETSAIEVGETAPYTFVYLLHQTAPVFSPTTMKAVTAGLENRLKKKGWRIEQLIVAEDHVYLFAHIPLDEITPDIINKLQKMTGHLAQASDENVEPEALWAKAYMMLSPGRQMPADEIHRFIRFAQG